MCAADNQVVVLYEQAGLSVEDISKALGYGVEAVKSTLLQCSMLYRNFIASKEAPVEQQIKEDISDAEFAAIRAGMFEIAMDDDPDFKPTRARMLKFLYNEKKGRNDLKTVKNSNTSVVLINQRIVQAREALKRVEQTPTPEAVLIES